MIFNQLLFIKAKLLTKFQILVQSNTNKPFSTSQFSPNSFLNLKPFSILLSWTFSLQSSWRTVYYLNPTSQVQIHIPSNTLSLYNPSKTVLILIAVSTSMSLKTLFKTLTAIPALIWLETWGVIFAPNKNDLLVMPKYLLENYIQPFFFFSQMPSTHKNLKKFYWATSILCSKVHALCQHLKPLYQI